MAERWNINGRSRIIFLIGTPVAQTQSPGLFNRHFAERGIDRVVAPLELKPAHLASFLAMVRDAENCDGVILTVPHKQAALDIVDEATDRARVLGAVNVVRRSADGSLSGDMADGPGFWAGAKAHGFVPAGKSVIMTGARAAATAIAHEMAARGGRRLTIVNRDPGEASRLTERLANQEIEADLDQPADLSAYDMAINATPLGMHHAPGTPFDTAMLATLPPRAYVADAVTEPRETQLLADARALGLRTVPGAAMTKGQFEILGGFLEIL